MFVPSAQSLECAGYCFLLGVAQYFLYRVNFNQYFQGDAIFWMHYRFRSVGEFLRAFLSLDAAHWYRPLSNRTIPALLFPLFGLEPHAYHLLQFCLLLALSSLVFLFLLYLSAAREVAFAGAFVFGVHTLHFYTAYDFAFAPELFYTFFYVLAVWMLIHSERRGSLALRLGAAACVLLSLASKEAAVTLPAVLLVAHLTFCTGGLKRAVRVLAAPLAVWVTYLAYVVGYLGVGGGDYRLSPGNVLNNLLNALYWAFNLRRDGWLPTRAALLPVRGFLMLFALLVLALLVRHLWTGERRLAVFGVLWFGITLLPMLLLNVFGPYYLCSAMVGGSLIAGLALSSLYRAISLRSAGLARVCVGAVLAMTWLSCRSLIAADTAGDIAMGYASAWAANSAEDLLRAHPRLPAGSQVYILNDAEPELWRFHGLGNLFKLVYGDVTISTAYKSLGQSPGASGSGQLVVMRAEGKHLVDVTADFEKNRGLLLGNAADVPQEVDRPGVRLSVEPAEVTAGKDFCTLGALGLGADEIVVQYTVDDGPVAEDRLRLNGDGRVRFFVSELTPVGRYRFLRFRDAAAPALTWIRSDATVVVHPPASAPAQRPARR